MPFWRGPRRWGGGVRCPCSVRPFGVVAWLHAHHTTAPERAVDEPPLDPARIVHVPANHGVQYLLVGGVADQAHGAKRKTFDVDCLTRHQPESLARLCAALTELNARLRVEGLSDDDAKALSRGVIHPEYFARAEIATGMTDAGPLDILHDIPARDGTRRSYEQPTRANRSGTSRTRPRAVIALTDRSHTRTLIPRRGSAVRSAMKSARSVVRCRRSERPFGPVEDRRLCNAATILVVDGNNVIGAVADGWWRDRPAAVRRLLGRMQCLGEPAVLVLDVAQPDLVEGDHGGITVRYATRRGRDAADDRIRELIADTLDATVVTSDRVLRHDVEAAGLTVIGAKAYLARLEAAGC